MTNSSGRVLYISYDGLLEPLGESQVLQYLEALANTHSILLISYEKPDDWANRERRQLFRRRLDVSGIRWTPFRYTKSPVGFATAYDVVRGLIASLYLTVRYRVKLVHARSYVPGVIAFYLKALLGTGFIFDIRGFWPDERINAGQWTHHSRIYRLAKWFETRFFKSANVIVSLTEAAAQEIRKKSYLKDMQPDIRVIPTCVNTEFFKPAERRHKEVLDSSSGGEFVLGCVGSVGGWFRFDAVLGFFTCVAQIHPSSRLLVLNRGQHELIHQMVEQSGLPDDRIDIVSAEFDTVPRTMAMMSAGVFFYQPSYSELARSPTKLGEFLACGVPCVTNRGVGDCEAILTNSGAGVIIDDLTVAEYRRGAEMILEVVRQNSTTSRCIDTANKYFCLETGIASYDRIYKEALG